MGKRIRYIQFLITTFFIIALLPLNISAVEESTVSLQKQRIVEVKPYNLDKKIMRFSFNSGLHFNYPDAVRGIYVTGNSAGGKKFNSLLKLIESSDLNAMVIDVKDDHGYITFKPDKDSSLHKYSQDYIDDMRKVLETLEKKEVYPIARITVFKDSNLAEERPDLSFTKNGKVWVNNRGEAFVNPF